MCDQPQDIQLPVLMCLMRSGRTRTVDAGTVVTAFAVSLKSKVRWLQARHDVYLRGCGIKRMAMSSEHDEQGPANAFAGADLKGRDRRADCC
jgi:hypothetical protein